MQVKPIFVCSICGNENEDKEYIARCEQAHLKLQEIASFNYTRRARAQEIPDWVTIRFANGRLVAYNLPPDSYSHEGLDRFTD